MPPPAAPALDPAASYEQLKSAVLGAQSNVAPGASPLGTFPELSKLYGSSFEVPISNANAGADSARTNITVSNDKAAAAAAASASEDNPAKYKQVLKPDGGYAFYDNAGNEISAAMYAAKRNQSVADVLKNSYNPIDKAFVNDFNQLQKYITDKQNSKTSKDAFNRAQVTEKQVQKLYGVNLAKQNPQQVIQTFMAAYPTVFGGNTTGPQGTNTFLPNNDVIKSGTKSSVSNRGL